MTTKLQIQIITNRHDWDELPHTQWQHTWEYGAVQEANGRVATRFLMRKNGLNVGFFQAITYPLWRDYTITYLPYGPVWLEQANERDQTKLRRVLSDYGDERNSICVRLESQEDLEGTMHTPLWAYRTSFHQPRGEAVLDLEADSNDLFSACSKSTRRNIRKSLKEDLECEFYHGEAMLDHLDSFIALNRENTQTHGTTTHDREYFLTLFSILARNKDNYLTLVRSGEQILAINIFTVFGTRAYCPFGASSEEGKRLGAYYRIKWENISHLQSLGVREFNWGGIAIGRNDENLRGLNQFKLGWNTKEKHHGDFHDVILSPLYWLYLVRTYLGSLRKS